MRLKIGYFKKVKMQGKPKRYRYGANILWVRLHFMQYLSFWCTNKPMHSLTNISMRRSGTALTWTDCMHAQKSVCGSAVEQNVKSYTVQRLANDMLDRRHIRVIPKVKCFSCHHMSLFVLKPQNDSRTFLNRRNMTFFCRCGVVFYHKNPCKDAFTCNEGAEGHS